jgi:tetratricopeptide (TPR) repeat protein
MADASYDAFISYRSGDLALAEEVNRRLVAEGFRVWFDKARLDPGCKWHAEIEAGCEASRIILPVLTPRWQESEWTRFETYGHDCALGLWFEGEGLEDILPPPLRGMQHVDLRAPTEAGWQALCAALRRLLGEPLPEKAPRVAHLPYAHNPYFVGRERLLLAIHERLHPAPTVALTHAPAFVVAGIGGVGKTMLAREYAERFWRLYRQTLWVSAAQTSSLMVEFARLALEMGLLTEPTADVGADAALALRALAADTPRLLIIDNAEDEEAVQAWVPQTGGCRTIITSRFTSWSPAFECVPVHVLEREPARALLLGRGGLQDSPDNLHAADRLADILGYLPLALEQAAAFIRETRVSLERYLTLQEQSRQELLARKALGGTQYPDSVATTWLLTMGKLTPTAQAILRLSAFLASEGVPRDLLDGSEELMSLAAAEFATDEELLASLVLTVAPGEPGGEPDMSFDLLPAEAEPDTTEAEIELGETTFGLLAEAELDVTEAETESDETTCGLPPEAEELITIEAEPLTPLALALGLGELGRYSMIELGETTFDIHRLVQAVERDRLDPTIRHRWVSVAVAVLSQAFPDVEFGNWPRCAQLAPHAVACARHIQQEGIESGTAAWLLNAAGNYLAARADYAGAEPLYRQAMEVSRKALGEESPGHADSLNNLALLYQARGNYAAAEPLNRQALEIWRRTVGEGDPRFATGLGNLGALYLAQGNLAPAERLLEQALEIDRKAAGEARPSFAASLTNLAQVYQAQGNYAAAEPLYRQALEIQRQALGDEHPDFATGLNNLAALYHAQGAYASAEPLYRQALEIDRQALGDDHPDFAGDLHNLAMLYAATADYVAAEPLFRQALDIRWRSLGSRHPHTRSTMRNLAAVCEALSKNEEAAALRKEADEDQPNDEAQGQ